MDFIRRSPFEKVVLATLFAFIVFYWLTQPRISLNDGIAYDAESYVAMAQQYAGLESTATPIRPFAYRVGLPFIVGNLFGGNILDGFFYVNMMFAFLTLWLLYHFVKYYISDNKIVLLLLLFFVINPSAPFRFLHFFPATVDPPAMFLILLILHLNNILPKATLKTAVCIAALSATGVWFREIVLSAALVYTLSNSVKFRITNGFVKFSSFKIIAISLIPSVAGVASLVFLHELISPAGDYRYPSQIPETMAHLIDNWAIFPLAWFTAFGAVFGFVVAGANSATLRMLIEEHSLLIFVGGITLLALIGGYHTDRFIYWGYPVVMVIFGAVLQSRNLNQEGMLIRALLYVPLVVIQIMAFRVFLPIPDDADQVLFNPGDAEVLMFAPYGESNLAHTYAAYMLPSARLELLIQFLLITVYFFVVFRFVRRSTR